MIRKRGIMRDLSFSSNNHPANDYSLKSVISSPVAVLTVSVGLIGLYTSCSTNSLIHVWLYYLTYL